MVKRVRLSLKIYKKKRSDVNRTGEEEREGLLRPVEKLVSSPFS